MVNYKCIRCGYDTNHKSKMKLHLSRKTICKPLLNDILLDDYKQDILNGKIYEEYKKNLETQESSVILGKSSVKLVKSSVNLCKNIDLDNSSKDSFEIKTDNKNNLICQYCNKNFARKDYLENHLKKSCKMLKEFNNIYNYDEKTFGKNIYKDFENAGDIYIVQTDYINDDHYKIGITNNIRKRMGSYRCGNTYEPRLHYYISCEDIKLIDNKIKIDLVKYCVKREIFKGDVEELKDKIVDVIKKEFKLDKVYVHEPDIKIGDLSECVHCNKCFYTKNDLFDHVNSCENYKEYLSKKKDSKYQCQFCEKSFSFSQSLYRHLKICKDKKKNDEDKNNLLNLVEMLNDQLKEQREEFKKALNKRDEELSKRDNQIDELIKKAGITNNITQNIQQNIKLLAYNNTDISHLKDKDYLKCLNHSNMCIPHLIKKIHFNPEKPENHNIYISNLKNNFALVYDGSKWNLQNRNETVEDLINNNEDILEQKLEEWIENGNNFPEIMKKFNRYLEKKEHDVVLNKIKEEIKLILYNNRSLIKEIDI